MIPQIESTFLTVPQLIDQVYQPASLSEYTFKQRLLIRAADLVFYLAISLIGKTLRYDTEGWKNLEAIETAGHVPIYTFWHDRIFQGTYFWRNRGIVIITSKSFDGEYIARFIQRFGYGAIRGSSSRGGSRALVEMIRKMREGLPMGFSIDGPRGPRYRVKPGPVLLAKKTGNPMMPFILEPKNFWTINSWDKMQIPTPFTRVRVIIGKPIYVKADSDEEQKLEEIQTSLDELVARGKVWSGRSD